MLGWIFKGADWAMRADVIVIFGLSIAYLVIYYRDMKKDQSAGTERSK